MHATMTQQTAARRERIALFALVGWIATYGLCAFFCAGADDMAQARAMIPGAMAIMVLFPLVLSIMPTPEEYRAMRRS
jgi:hypothetical protein